MNLEPGGRISLLKICSIALHSSSVSSKEAWENKVKVYRSFGLSDAEVQSAFRAHPLCMMLSEEKISQGMDFFVNEMGWSPAIVARWLTALFYHLEKRIIPRCRVIKGLVEVEGFGSTLLSPELRRTVLCAIDSRQNHLKVIFLENRHQDDSNLFNSLFKSSCRLFSSVSSKDFPVVLSRETSVGKHSVKKVEQVKTLFRNYGFDESHISHIARIQPKVFLYNPQNTLLPKLDFLRSIGVSNADIPKVIMRNPALMGRSLEKQIWPCYNFLKSLPLSGKEVVMMVNRNSRILATNVEKIAGNVQAMQQVGVPPRSISYFISRFPASVQRDNEKFRKSLDEVISMGFNPLRLMFILAVRVRCETTKPTWDYKVKVFKRFGLSGEAVMSAFRLHPGCMNVSEEKVLRVMDFFINKMKWEPIVVIRSPAVLLYNLEKRIIPRCNVITLLMQKGFLKENFPLMSFLKYSEVDFLNKFVYNYKDDLTQLVDVYRQGMAL
ncbi:unnamed protein product [Fraxinus pennsylvanica]|uniref:Uncharacterized protein n=1 Tax=Fraxinus pennsylvanica TaxID=56036 RepID=A0AAD1ZY43_9LAMI|nr:unnamed protein product [Fraxinus pennsylvanica]